MSTFASVREAIVAQVGPLLESRATRLAALGKALATERTFLAELHPLPADPIAAFDAVLHPVVGLLPLAKEARERPDDDGTDPTDEAQAAAALASLDLSGFAVLVNPTTDVLESVALGGARQGVLSVKALVPEADDFALPNDVVRSWAQDHAASLVGKRVLEDGTVIDNPRAEYAISEATRTLVRGTINDAFAGEGMSRDELAAALTDAYAFSEQRAQQIARTEIGFALEAGNRAAWQASGVVPEVEIVLGDLHEVPDICDDIVGVYPIGSAPVVPLHPNCLLGSTVVAAVGTTAQFKRRYAGKVVGIRAEGVPEFSATPNHPVLTARGWVPAGEIRKGDRLVYCADQRGFVAALRQPDDHEVPAPIEQIAAAARMATGMTSRRVPLAPEDFHGDASADGEVEIVAAGGLLEDDHLTARDECVTDGALALAHGGRGPLARDGVLLAMGQRLPLSTDRIVGGLGAARALVGGQSGVQREVGINHVADGQAGTHESLSDRGAVAPDAARDVHAGLARQVAAVQGGDVPLREAAGGVNARLLLAHRQAACGEPSNDHLVRDVLVPSEARDWLAGHVTTVEVVDLFTRDFVGHVFNLQTDSHVYLAEGVVVHNCTCASLPVVSEAP